jgi:hypothetical protein
VEHAGRVRTWCPHRGQHVRPGVPAASAELGGSS